MAKRVLNRKLTVKGSPFLMDAKSIVHPPMKFILRYIW